MSELRICAFPGCKEPTRRPNSAYCGDLHKRLAKEQGLTAPAPAAWKTPKISLSRVTEPDPRWTSAVPCTRPGYPKGILEGKDSVGLPVFFDRIEGVLLARITGPGTISDFQLRNMGFERTELTFPGGIFCWPIRQR